MEDTDSTIKDIAGAEELYTARQVSTWKRLRQSPSAMIGLVLFGMLLLVSLGADALASQGIDEQDLRRGLEPPGDQFPLGADELGRDLLSRIIHGSRVSLQVGVTTMVASASVGIILGTIAGYFGGRIDYFIQGMIDISWAFPIILMAIFLVAVLGPSLANVMLAVGLVFWGGYARVVRGQVLSLREWEFVLAARAIGAGDLRIMLRHIVPNFLSPVIVMATLQMGDAILIEASLSYLGMGAQPPTPSWGSILSDGRSYMSLAPWLTIYPGVAIMLSVMGLNLLGDGLRDALDPRLKER